MRRKIHSFFKKHPALSLCFSVTFFIGIEGLFSFCSKTKCPAFSDAYFDKWFPYTQGQSIYFTSSLSRKDTIAITHTNKSAAGSTYSGSSSCGMDASIYSNAPNPSSNAKLSITLSKYASGKTLNIYLYNFYVSGNDLTDQGVQLANTTTKAQYYPSLTINGRTYSNVEVIEKDTSSSKQVGIYKLWLAQQNGLVAYEHYPTLEQWVKQ